jgi:hypothetical protein
MFYSKSHDEEDDELPRFEEEEEEGERPLGGTVEVEEITIEEEPEEEESEPTPAAAPRSAPARPSKPAKRAKKAPARKKSKAKKAGKKPKRAAKRKKASKRKRRYARFLSPEAIVKGTALRAGAGAVLFFFILVLLQFRQLLLLRPARLAARSANSSAPRARFARVASFRSGTCHLRRIANLDKGIHIFPI